MLIACAIAAARSVNGRAQASIHRNLADNRPCALIAPDSESVVDSGQARVILRAEPTDVESEARTETTEGNFMSGSIAFDPEMVQRLQKARQAAVAAGETSFTFEGNEYDVETASELVSFLLEEFENRGVGLDE